MEMVPGRWRRRHLLPNLDTALAHSITRRTGGRIESLQIETVAGRVVIHGRTRSYHALQLVQAAVVETLRTSGSERPEDAEFDIEVVSGRDSTKPGSKG